MMIRWTWTRSSRRQSMRTVRSVAAPLAIGAGVGALFGTSIEGSVVETYYRVSPVITATWTADKMPDGAFAVRFAGVKHKPCALEAVIGYDVTSDGIRTRLKIARPDHIISRDYKIGPFNSRTPWVVMPPPVGRLELSFEHRCGTRTVITPVAQT